MGPTVKWPEYSFKKFEFNAEGRKSMKFFNLWKSLPELYFRKITLTIILRMDWRQEK